MSAGADRVTPTEGEDTKGHRFQGIEPAPAPDTSGKDGPATPDQDDTEGHRFHGA